MGIAKYNAECRSIVTRYSAEWRTIIGRCGRWIDFDNDYKTLDLKFMESVWWVFKQIWEKGHVYRGCRVMPYSNGCNTVLSNFETQQNYKEVVDPAIYITFPWVKDPDTKFVAWTTTPWTLPSNLALVVHPTFEYVRVFDHEHKTHFVIAE
jgi:isoleucyl-tRNA synthetase